MAMIKAGTYRFNDVLGVPNSNITQAVNFTTSPAYDENLTPTEGTMAWTSITLEGTVTPQVSYAGNAGSFAVYNGHNDYCWNYFNLVLGVSVLDERIQTITIPEDTEVSDEFEPWFTANTKRLSTITYNGSIIASLLGGQTATLKCAGMKMESDVVVDVAEQNGGVGECNHEGYDFAQSSLQVRLKSKIEKPTEVQQAMFVDGDIALVSLDAERIWSTTEFYYKNIEFIPGLPVKPVTVRSRVIPFESNSVFFYYLWEDDVEILKAAVSSYGVDLSGFGEGWYTIGGELGLIPCTQELLEGADFDEALLLAMPYGDYLYSIFDFYTSNDAKPAGIANVHYYGQAVLALRTQDKLCESDIAIQLSVSSTDAYDENGQSLSNFPAITRHANIGCVKIDAVSLNDTAGYGFGVEIDQRFWQFNGQSNTLPLSFREKNFIYTRNTYGIYINVSDGDYRLKDVLTNATIVSKQNNTAFISQLPNDTHVVLVVERITG